MRLFTLEHSPWAYRADLALYAAASVALAAYLMLAGPSELRAEIVVVTLFGLAAWSAVEYSLHRFVLHGLQPFRRWHAEHHRRPAALICTPTILSALLFALLVWLPAWLLDDRWSASALTLGMLSGYLVFGLTHHVVHHSRSDSAWVLRRKRWHALHHHRLRDGDAPHGHYGVTSALWDHVFGSVSR